jgi:energy-coupling factor transport system ATP-binding protein
MVIECRDVSFRYDAACDSWALSGVDFRIGPGERLLITGPTGSGKTTLLQILDALIMPEKGDTLFDGMSVRELSRRKMLHTVRRRIGMLFQFPEEHFFHQSAYDELAFALRNFFEPDEHAIERRAESIAAAVGLDIRHLRSVSPFSLSSGQKRRLALAGALMVEPEILMLDEPTAGLDAAGRHEVVALLSSLEDAAVVVVTHNMEDFLHTASRIVCLDGGETVFDGPREDLLSRTDLPERFPGEIPLVVKVQQWLESEGLGIGRWFWRMEDLLRHMEARLPGPGRR